MHSDLFSHHAFPLECYVFVAVDERGEDEMMLRVSGDALYTKCVESFTQIRLTTIESQFSRTSNFGAHELEQEALDIQVGPPGQM